MHNHFYKKRDYIGRYDSELKEIVFNKFIEEIEFGQYRFETIDYQVGCLNRQRRVVSKAKVMSVAYDL